MQRFFCGVKFWRKTFLSKKDWHQATSLAYMTMVAGIPALSCYKTLQQFGNVLYQRALLWQRTRRLFMWRIAQARLCLLIHVKKSTSSPVFASSYEEEKKFSCVRLFIWRKEKAGLYSLLHVKKSTGSRVFAKLSCYKTRTKGVVNFAKFFYRVNYWSKTLLTKRVGIKQPCWISWP